MMQKIKYLIRRAVVSDAVKISEIEKECFSLPWSLQQVRNEIPKNNVIFLSAVTDDDFCGYISGQLILDEFYISNVAVTEKFRRFGVGSALIDNLITELKNTECSLITLEVRVSNHSARHVYEKFGFQNLGLRKKFYSHPTEDACIYTLYLKKEGEDNENSCN